MSKKSLPRQRGLRHGPWRLVILAVLVLLVMTLFMGLSIADTPYLIIDGDTVYAVEGHSDDIEEAFARAGITLGEHDTYLAEADGGLTRVEITRTAISVLTRTEPIPYETTRLANPNLAAGIEQVAREGEAGRRVTVTEIALSTGCEPVERLVDIKLTEPVCKIIEYGTKVESVAQSFLSVTDDVLTAVDEEGGLLTTLSGLQLAYSDVLTCTATAYTTERQAWKITATGTTARLGAIAVDPKVIPYGTRMYIVSSDGSITYGVATAEDCGGSIKGNKIDLFFNTYDECISFGRRSCTVYILS
jgi:3D (Asp-Asp-Asp) domain-containing protein/uncharacterized protein YabE (DUF348 family)